MAGLDHDVALAPAAWLGRVSDRRAGLVVSGRDSGLRADAAGAPAMAAAAARAFLDERAARASQAWRVLRAAGRRRAGHRPDPGAAALGPGGRDGAAGPLGGLVRPARARPG